MPDQTETAPVVLHDTGMNNNGWVWSLARMVKAVRARRTARSRECRIVFDDGVTVVVVIQRVEP